MNRKIFKITFLLAIAGFLSWMGFLIAQKASIKKEAEQKVQQLPDFEFYTLDGGAFTKASLREGAPVSVILFNSECDLCLYEAGEIKKKIALFKDMEVLMVSDQPAEAIRQFADTYGLAGQNQVKVLRDKKQQLLKLFGTEAIPTVFIYDKSHRLLKKYIGETKPEAILKAANLIP